tara:strand:+ start:59 stop:439 length:381 start_codon:yes stop_codon:yes gene_type:complete
LRVIKTREFAKWAEKEGLLDESLMKAINEIEVGLIDANLGGNLLKKRVSLGAKGKSSGLRTIIAYKSKDKYFFIYGYKKNKRSNISKIELKALKKLGDFLIFMTNKDIIKAILAKELRELKHEKEK